MDTPTRTAGKDTANTLRAIEQEIEALATLSVNEVPHAVRTILRAIANLLIAARWLVEDQLAARVGIVAGDGNDL